MSATRGGFSAMARACAAVCAVTVAGCGSTLTSNTPRTATEQLLISDAIDRTVEAIDFSPLKDQTVFFDDAKLGEVIDKAYLLSSLRQHLLASGCVLKTNRDEAMYVVEARAGAVGTDNYELLLGVPALQVPQVGLGTPLPSAIPEIPCAKRREQRGVAKVAVFAYRRDTGEPVWQSGLAKNESTAKNVWVFGAGPFRRGTIYGDAKTKDHRTKHRGDVPDEGVMIARLGDEATFAGLHHEPSAPKTADSGVMQASATEPALDAAEAAATPPAESPPAEPKPAEPAPGGMPPAKPIEQAPKS
jgi:hypothetical protein